MVTSYLTRCQTLAIYSRNRDQYRATEPNSASIVYGGRFNCRVIWIQPSSLLEKNKQEILDWNIDLLPSQVKVVKGSTVQKKKIIQDQNVLVWLMTAEAYASYIREMRNTFHDIVQVICDEPHLYYRGFNSKRTQSFVTGTPDWVRVNFLTATPTPRGKLNSAYTYCHMIQKSYYGSYEFFMNTHAVMDEYNSVQYWLRPEVLRKFLENYSICWTAKDMYGDVEQKIFREELDMSKKIADVYNKFEDEGLAEIQDAVLEAKTGGTNSIRIRQILAHPHKMRLPAELDKKGNVISYHDLCITDEITPKIQRIVEYAEEGEPIIVFGTFTEELEKIAAVLRAKNFRVGVIHGQVSQGRRAELDQEFRDGKLDVMVCSAATAGVGFNWGFVNTIIYHSLNYGDDEFLQAAARAKRGVRAVLLRLVILEYKNTADQLIMWAIHHNSKVSNSANRGNPIVYFPKPAGGKEDVLSNGLTMDYV